MRPQHPHRSQREAPDSDAPIDLGCLSEPPRSLRTRAAPRRANAWLRQGHAADLARRLRLRPPTQVPPPRARRVHCATRANPAQHGLGRRRALAQRPRPAQSGGPRWRTARRAAAGSARGVRPSPVCAALEGEGEPPAASTAAASVPKRRATVLALGQSPLRERATRHSWPWRRARAGLQSAQHGGSP